MSLTRSFLKSLGLEEEKISSIIEAHSETVSALNQRYSELETRYNDAKQSADQLPELQKELETMKKEDFRTKYESEKSAHEALRESLARKESRAACEKAVRAYYIGKSIKGDNLTIAMRGTPLDDIKLGEDGTIADTKVLDKLVEGDFRPLVDTGVKTVSSGGTLAPRGNAPAPTPSSVMNQLIRGKTN